MVVTDIGSSKVARAPAMAGGQVVAVGHAGHVHLLDLGTGQTLWTVVLSAEVGTSACDGQPVTVGIVNDIVLAGCMGHVFAIRIDSGMLLWHTEHRARGAGETNLAISATAVVPPVKFKS
jgi:outer membrane protein assembly factor BamB